MPRLFRPFRRRRLQRLDCSTAGLRLYITAPIPHAAGMEELDRLLRGLQTYQDLVVGGVVVRRGVRNCEERWSAIAPHLPSAGVLLDVGANFCWFAQRWCREGPERLAVALEADLRSAAVARYSLAADGGRGTALCTALAGAQAMARFARAGQRFDAALCLSVLHWIPDHREFLRELGAIADRIFIEQPDPREVGAGREEVRRAIGPIGPYLKALFPERPVERLATWTAHRDADLPRELWLVGPQNGANPSPPTVQVDVAALVDLDVAWPPRSWWQQEFAALGKVGDRRLLFTPDGLTLDAGPATASRAGDWPRRLARLPETGVTTVRRRVRRAAAAVTRRLRRLVSH